MEGHYEATGANRIKITIIAQVLKPLPYLLIRAVTTLCLCILNLSKEESLETLKCDTTFCRVISEEDFSLELSFRKIGPSDAFTKTFEFAKSELLVQEHVKFAKNLLQSGL